MQRLMTVDDYQPFIGKEAVERIKKKAEPLKDLHLVNVNSTYYGGGVAEIMASWTLLMDGLGIKTGWRIVHGPPDFFTVTKKMHNALQGRKVVPTKQELQLYEEVNFENSVRNHLDHDLVIIHDPQPLPLINHYTKRGPWIWRCHVDLSHPNPRIWNYLVRFVEKYDAAVFSLKEYMQQLSIPQVFFMPAIDPFTLKNRDLSEPEMEKLLQRYNIPTDLPLVVQVSRFDPWKDPQGVIEAFKIARKEVEATLVLLGNVATDDPEGPEVYESLLGSREERIIILSCQDSALVNALQRKAAVVVQKSIREGFGLTVTEAMWKGAAVIGGKVGGIRNQIEDGVSGFLVTSVSQTADRIVRLLKDRKLRARMGKNARETVRKRFLMTRYLEQYLNLFNSFETSYRLKGTVTTIRDVR
jgi:trehalose synthase